jgi:hypothetical protein
MAFSFASTTCFSSRETRKKAPEENTSHTPKSLSGAGSYSCACVCARVCVFVCVCVCVYCGGGRERLGACSAGVHVCSADKHARIYVLCVRMCVCACDCKGGGGSVQWDTPENYYTPSRT